MKFSPVKQNTMKQKPEICEEQTRLTTVQPVAVWEHLRREKRLFVDPAHPDFYGHKYPTAYGWLREQMGQRLYAYQGHYPWWAWIGCEPKCMMKGAWVYGSGEILVRMELVIARKRLLISEFSAWHSPLNESYLALSCAEGKAWDQECLTRFGLDLARLADLPPDMQARVHLSWERCFDAPLLEESEFFTQGLYQATFEELRLTDVTKMTRFRRRLKSEPTPSKVRRLPEGQP